MLATIRPFLQKFWKSWCESLAVLLSKFASVCHGQIISDFPESPINLNSYHQFIYLPASFTFSPESRELTAILIETSGKEGEFFYFFILQSPFRGLEVRMWRSVEGQGGQERQHLQSR